MAHLLCLYLLRPWLCLLPTDTTSITLSISSFNLIIYFLSATHPTLSELIIVIIIMGYRLRLFTINQFLHCKVCDGQPQLYEIPKSKLDQYSIPAISTSYKLLANLKMGRCSNTAKVRFLRFWEARNVQKCGKLMSVGMLFIDEITPASSISLSKDRLFQAIALSTYLLYFLILLSNTCDSKFYLGHVSVIVLLI